MEMNQFSAGDRIICKYSDATDWIYKVEKLEKKDRNGVYHLLSPSGVNFECQQANVEDVCELYEKGR